MLRIRLAHRKRRFRVPGPRQDSNRPARAGRFRLSLSDMLAKTPVPAPSGFVPCDPLRQARLSLSCLESMTDAKRGGLPWGSFQLYCLEPFAEHSRRDDSEFAASWYEGISCAREMLGTSDGEAAEAALRKIVLDPECWEEETGLRYPKRRPWSGKTDWCAISEMGAVLSALNRMV